MVVNGETVGIPATVENIAGCGKRYGGVVQGDTNSLVDVRFPNVHAAASFHQNFGEDWTMSLYEQVLSFNMPVVVVVCKERVTAEEEVLYVPECEGHESLDGAHMGDTVYCDGSCVVTA